MQSTAIFALFLVFNEIGAQVPSLQACPSFETVPNFNLTRYLGRWYESERFFASFEFGAKCVSADYSPNVNGSIKVVNRQINTITGANSSIEGVARSVRGPGTAKLGVKFPPSPIEGPYWILATDYDNYALVWSCSNFGFISMRFSWILSRSPTISSEALQIVNEVITKYEIRRGNYMKTDQLNCST